MDRRLSAFIGGSSFRDCRAPYPGRIALSASAITIAATVLTMPGNMKLWFSRYFPILVVPV